MSKKKSRIQDRFADREAQRYEQPIPSREFILEYLAENADSGPAKRKKLAKELNIKDETAYEALGRRLKAMVRDGQLMRLQGGYVIAVPQTAIQARLKLEREGSGSVLIPGTFDKIYLSPREIRGLCEGDLLEVRPTQLDQRGQAQGVVQAILEMKTPRLVGTYRSALPSGYIEPRHRFYRTPFAVSLSPDLAPDTVVADGDWVVVRIKRGETGREAWSGEIIELLGAMIPLELEMTTVMEAHDLPREWPEAVLKEVSGLADTVTEAAKKDRLDLSALPLVTIDGEDARDFDDAVYCEARPQGAFRLWVAIADVSHYVKVGTALDHQARLRGTSVYFPNTVIPMLPEKLSNGLCSLNPEVDRLCVVCELHLTATGALSSFKFHKAFMRSKARLTYTKVAAMLAGDQPLQEEYQHVWPHIQTLGKLFQILSAQRKLRGAIEFETIETRILFDKQGEVEKIIPVVRNVAHRIIEECMLMANVAAATFLIQENLPALFRVHAGPSAEKLKDLRAYLGLFALSLGGKDNPRPKDYAALIMQIKDRPDAHVLQMVLLRSLSQAVYTPKNLGHFGLSYDAYVHFTSPIRRYPDLMVHRALVSSIERKAMVPEDFEALGEHCSFTERRADEASREVVLAMKCRYMHQHLGDEFEAIVTGVTAFGLFAELQGLYVEGLIHISTLGNDYYIYDPMRFQLKGERTNTIFKAGDQLQVRVSRVDIEDRKLDFELLWKKEDGKPKKKK